MENRNIIYYKQLDSTNTQIERLAGEGEPHGTVVVAESQTHGKGRRGRSWESSPEGNIYMSVLLRPQIEPQKAPMLTIVMAYSVAKAIQKQGYENIQIKWPNDLILSGKKVCGILTEMHLVGETIDYVVVGVGVNVNTTDFSKELYDKATSLYLESNRRTERKALIENIMKLFEKNYHHFIQKGNLSFLQEEYNSMLVNRGRTVKVLEPGAEYMAYALGMNDVGELLVKKEDGSEQTVFAGEVSVRGIYGYV